MYVALANNSQSYLGLYYSIPRRALSKLASIGFGLPKANAVSFIASLAMACHVDYLF